MTEVKEPHRATPLEAVEFRVIRNPKEGVPTRRCDVEAFAAGNKRRNIIVEIKTTGVGSAFADYLEGEGFMVRRLNS
jgi:hypothetical protein